MLRHTAGEGEREDPPFASREPKLARVAGARATSRLGTSCRLRRQLRINYSTLTCGHRVVLKEADVGIPVVVGSEELDQAKTAEQHNTEIT